MAGGCQRSHLNLDDELALIWGVFSWRHDLKFDTGKSGCAANLDQSRAVCCADNIKSDGGWSTPSYWSTIGPYAILNEFGEELLGVQLFEGVSLQRIVLHDHAGGHGINHDPK